jgi:hypothetical protein
LEFGAKPTPSSGNPYRFVSGSTALLDESFAIQSIKLLIIESYF